MVYIPMSPVDPNHWLWRLSAEAWLHASENELSAAKANLHVRKVAITHCRRSAGMALNAILAGLAEPSSETRWGRSYVEHLQMLAQADEQLRAPLPETTCVAAQKLLEIPIVDRSSLIQIHRSANQPMEAAIHYAQMIYDDCARILRSIGSR